MKTYTFYFIGRYVGAIGITSHFSKKVLSNDYDSALLELYKTYEHITVLTVHIDEVQ